MDPYANPFDTNQTLLPGVGDLSDFYLNTTPDAAFARYLRDKNLAGTGNAVSKFAQGQQNRTYNQYQAHIADEPNLGFWDYLKRVQPDFQADFMNMSPSQRGDQSGKFLTPRARFVNAY
jgi:hypothetical protein